MFNLKKFEKLEAIYALLLKKYNIPREEVLNIYLFGSRVYGTHTEESDFDIVIVINDKLNINNQEIKHPVLNLHIYTKSFFQEKLNEHKVKFLEVFLVPDNYKIEKYKFNFQLNLSLLRKEISSTVNNSWVKCKKKLTVEDNEYYVGIKSLFHSFRIIDFGIQIAKYNKIEDFSSMNHLWEDIKNNYRLSWEDIYNTYKLTHNELLSDFRKLAPK